MTRASISSARQTAAPCPPATPVFIVYLFLEKIVFYGIRSGLVLLLNKKLNMPRNDAVMVFHGLLALYYFSGFLEGFLEQKVKIFKYVVVKRKVQNYFEKFNFAYRLAVLMNIIYIIGCIVCISPFILLKINQQFEELSYIPFDKLEEYIRMYYPGQDYNEISGLIAISKALTLCGLTMVMFAAGVLKPCILSLSTEQFKFLHHSKRYSRYLHATHVILNLAALIVAVLIPFVREFEFCKYCRFGVYWVLTGVLVIGSFVFCCSREQLIPATMRSNLALKNVFECIRVSWALFSLFLANFISVIVNVLQNARKNRQLNPDIQKEHWLEFADDQYDALTLMNARILLNLLPLFLPLPIFWSLFDQHSSTWVFQAQDMDRHLGVDLEPDHTQLLYPLFVLILIPFNQILFYKVLDEIAFGKPLQRMFIGFLVAIGAYLMALSVQHQIGINAGVELGKNDVHIRLFNAAPCIYEFQTDLDGLEKVLVNHMEMEEMLDFKMEQDVKKFNYFLSVFQPSSDQNNCQKLSGTDYIQKKSALGLFIKSGAAGNKSLIRFKDDTSRTPDFKPKIRSESQRSDFTKNKASKFVFFFLLFH